MSTSRMRFVVPGVAMVVAVMIAVTAWAGGAPGATAQPGSGLGAPTFEATFETPEDFYNRFDFGYSGLNPWDTGDNFEDHHGDHNLACEGPTTSRTVGFGGNQDNLDFSELFWHCAPGGDPSKGHVMTSVDTFGYNIAWFSPKAAFTGVSSVCWDVNATTVSRRKWLQVLFVDARPGADATRWPTGTPTAGDGESEARGTGGYDLGYTSPDFRQDAPNTGIFPESGTLAGLKIAQGIYGWFQDQDTWSSTQVGWPGRMGAEDLPLVTDKAARYTTCIENAPNNTLHVTEELAPEFGGGVRELELVGQLPQHPVRVVFQDDNYDPPKDELYQPDVVTWHWDDIQVRAAASEEVVAPPTTLPPPTSRPDAREDAVAALPGNFDADGQGFGELIALVILGGLVLFVGGVAFGALLRRDRPRREPTPPQR